MPRNGFNYGSLHFSIEQWELIRRLRNSGLTKEQIGQAFDDLNKIEQEMGSIYNVRTSPIQQQNNTSLSNLSGTEASSKFNSNQINMQIFQMAKNLSSMTQQTRTNSNSSHNSNGMHLNNLANGNFIKHTDHSKNPSPKLDNSNEHFNNNNNTSNTSEFKSTSSSNGNHSQSNSQTTAAASIVNAHFASQMEPEQEAKLLEEFKLKGEVVIHGEISFFVYKHDLKQSQIARMAGVNQAYVSKFLRGEFFDLSENGKSLIYKWYLRFLKNPTIFHQAHNISVNPNLSNNDRSNGMHALSAHDKSISSHNKHETSQVNSSNISFNNVTNTAYINDTPKRSRFSFKPEHLAILEKAFVETQYPDQKRREEISKQCNDAKPCPEKVTEQIVTHWFQNKRKITRKINMDEHASISPRENTGQNLQESYRNEDNNSRMNIHEDYRNDDANSLNDEYRNGDSNMSNSNNDYQNESLIEYQDYIEDENEFKPIIDNHNQIPVHCRKRSTEVIDY